MTLMSVSPGLTRGPLAWVAGESLSVVFERFSKLVSE